MADPSAPAATKMNITTHAASRPLLVMAFLLRIGPADASF
jgi:hypothetical protein